MKLRLFVIALLVTALSSAIFIYSEDFRYVMLCLTIVALILSVINLVAGIITIVKFYSKDL